jgi:hypothetical protein
MEIGQMASISFFTETLLCLPFGENVAILISRFPFRLNGFSVPSSYEKIIIAVARINKESQLIGGLGKKKLQQTGKGLRISYLYIFTQNYQRTNNDLQ